MNILEVNNISKSFGDKKIHTDISFSLKEGEIKALLGGSGSGKSLLLRMMIGLDRPDGGSIFYKQQDITDLSELDYYPIRKEISYVFQNGALFDSMTVADNLAYPLIEHTDMNEDARNRAISEMLKSVDMDDSQLLLPSELSGGMQKRAGFARALMLKPKVVLFDEPTAGLDPKNTKRLIENIKRFRSSGLTGIFVTHDIPSALSLCDGVMILNEGKIAVDIPTEVFRSSNDPLIRSYLE